MRRNPGENTWETGYLGSCAARTRLVHPLTQANADDMHDPGDNSAVVGPGKAAWFRNKCLMRLRCCQLRKNDCGNINYPMVSRHNSFRLKSCCLRISSRRQSDLVHACEAMSAEKLAPDPEFSRGQNQTCFPRLAFSDGSECASSICTYLLLKKPLPLRPQAVLRELCVGVVPRPYRGVPCCDRVVE